MNERGATLLMAVMIMGAIAVSVATTIMLSGIAASHTSLVVTYATQAEEAVKTCGELVLLDIRSDSNFLGSGTKIIDLQTCSYGVTSTGGEARDIELEVNVSGAVRRELIVTDQLFPQINISSWSLVKSF